MVQISRRELTPEQREAARLLAEMPPAPPAWTLYAMPGETRQQARARWRANTKRANGNGPTGPGRRTQIRVRGKYMPHQGARECARRRRQIDVRDERLEAAYVRAGGEI